MNKITTYKVINKLKNLLINNQHCNKIEIGVIEIVVVSKLVKIPFVS